MTHCLGHDSSGVTAAGMLSISVLDSPIVGPSHHHMRLPDHGSFFGRLTSEANPVSYIAALRQVYNDSCKEARPVQLRDGSEVHMPLIVNTPGWVKVRSPDMLQHAVDVLLFSRECIHFIRIVSLLL